MKRALAALLCLGASRADAQLQWEGRLDAVRTGRLGAEAGVGVRRSLGSYVRGGLNLGYDIVPDSGGERHGRIEGHIRFLLDPIAERRWGLSLGGGIGVRVRPYLVALAELEGPVTRGMRPAIQLALGAGLRLGLVVRAARRGQR